MSVARIPPDFIRGRTGHRSTGRRPESSGRRPFSTAAALATEPPSVPANGQAEPEGDFRWQLVRSLSDLRGYARRLTGDHVEASDLVQEACRRALEGRSLFTAGSDMRSWLCCIMRNLYRDRLRRLSREVLVPDYDQSPAWVSEGRPPWAMVSDDDLALALASLQPQYQQTYVLYAVDGQSYQEIARTLQVPSSTVGTRILRARLQLRDFLVKRIEAQPASH
jgi:RNA polymerase sigma-70 factor (ECF subfamily)